MLLAIHEGISEDSFWLSLGCKPLSNNLTLSELNFREGSVVSVHVRGRGGAPKKKKQRKEWSPEEERKAQVRRNLLIYVYNVCLE